MQAFGSVVELHADTAVAHKLAVGKTILRAARIAPAADPEMFAVRIQFQRREVDAVGIQPLHSGLKLRRPRANGRAAQFRGENGLKGEDGAGHQQNGKKRRKTNAHPTVGAAQKVFHGETLLVRQTENDTQSTGARQKLRMEL